MNTYDVNYELWVPLGNGKEQDFDIESGFVITTSNPIGLEQARAIAKLLHPTRSVHDLKINEV